MRWDELTVPDFRKAVRQVEGLCAIPMGILEKHGDQLPLGTDLFNVTAVVARAVQIEPAIMFPPYFFGQINCARHQPGTVSLRRSVTLELLENVCEEIARNGLRKIVLVNGHGGNGILLAYFVRTTLERRRDYVVYYVPTATWRMKKADWEALNMPAGDGHGGRDETSRVMAARPGLTKMEDLAESGPSLGRIDHLAGATIAVEWYARNPECYAGDANATGASEERGRIQFEHGARKLAEVFKAIKEDTTAAALTREFYDLADGHG